LPAGFSVVGFARHDLDTDSFRTKMHDAVEEFSGHDLDDAVWESFSAGISYVRGEFGTDDDYDKLHKELERLDNERGTQGNRLYYLATPPDFYGQIVDLLGKHKLQHGPSGSWQRIIIEKPFGEDLESAKALNVEVNKVFDESCVFRIDHYLGKETVQNIIALRFANGIFEPVWNRQYVSHVQITVAESLGIEGRGGYYDEAGAMRDIVQNHMRCATSSRTT
jgi:glucose-6-phosphate 1-dehydrogenase